jgi:hypothetical protein
MRYFENIRHKGRIDLDPIKISFEVKITVEAIYESDHKLIPHDFTMED